MTETLSWAARRDVFINRTLWIALITLAVLITIGIALSLYFGWAKHWVVPSALLLTAGFVVDDLLRWRTAKYDRWSIEDGFLIRDSQGGRVRIPLGQISSVSTWYGGRVIVRLTSGERLVIHSQRFPNQTAKTISNLKP